MFEALGYRVQHLVRTRIGTLRLGDLPRGQWRILTKRELAAVEAAILSGKSPRRWPL